MAKKTHYAAHYTVKYKSCCIFFDMEFILTASVVEKTANE